MIVETGTIVINPGKDSKFVKNKKFMGKLARVYIAFDGWETFQSDPSQKNLRAFIGSLKCEKVNIVQGSHSNWPCSSCPLRYTKAKDQSGCMIARAIADSIDAAYSVDFAIPASFPRTNSFGYELLRIDGKIDSAKTSLATCMPSAGLSLQTKKGKASKATGDDFDIAKALRAFTKLFGFIEGLVAVEEEKIAAEKAEPVILESVKGAWTALIQAKAAMACLELLIHELQRDNYNSPHNPAVDCLSSTRAALYQRLQKAYHNLLLLGQFLPPKDEMKKRIINETLEYCFDNSSTIGHLVTGEITEEELRRVVWDMALRYSS